MKRSRLALVFLMLTLVLCGTGCGRHGMAIFAGGMILGSALANASSHHEHERTTNVTTVVYANSPPTHYPAATPPPERSSVPDNQLPAFDPAAARSKLAAVELSKCSDSGAPRAFGHATVTFNPSGDISKVVIDEPGGMYDAAVKCIGDEIGKVRVAPFRGSLVTMGTTWYVP